MCKRKALLTPLEGHRAVLDNCKGFQTTTAPMSHTVPEILRSKRSRDPTLCFVLARGISTGPFGFPKGYPGSWLEAGKAGVVSQGNPWALGFFPIKK